MAVGLIAQQDIQKGVAHGAWNTVLYVGAKTGRDGINGATFASGDLSEQSESDRSSMQVGDPFMGKLLIEACLLAIKSEAPIGIQDMGAAGFTSSATEMASKAGTGMSLYLDDVPQREKDMTPYEISLSESQERMLLVVKRGREDEIIKIFEDHLLDAIKVGEVTLEKQFKL